MGRGGGAEELGRNEGKGNRKVRNKRLENGMGQPHACHELSGVEHRRVAF